MHKFLMIISCSLFFISCKKEKQASTINDYSIAENVALNKVTFLGNKCIIVGGERYQKNRIYVFEIGHSVNEIQYPQNATQKEVYGVSVAANGNILAVGYGGGIYSSIDSGINWTFVQNNTWRELQSVCFKNNDTAFVVGGVSFSDGLILKINKDGVENKQVRENRNFEIADIEFVNENVGYLSGYGTIMKTTDGGQVWNYTDAKNDYFKAMAWKNVNEGIAVGYNGTIIKTIDAGLSWKVIISGNNFLKKKYRLLDIAYDVSGAYVAVGEKGCIISSKDEGETWQEISSSTKNDLHGITFKNANSVIAVGDAGTLLEVVLE